MTAVGNPWNCAGPVLPFTVHSVRVLGSLWHSLEVTALDYRVEGDSRKTERVPQYFVGTTTGALKAPRTEVTMLPVKEKSESRNVAPIQLTLSLTFQEDLATFGMAAVH